MRVVAGLAAFVLLCGASAVAQYSPLPITTLPQGSAVFCIQPGPLVDLKHPEKNAKGSSETNCMMAVGVQSCPVDMHVRQRMSGSTLAVDANGVQRKIFAQRLRLFLNNFRPDPSGRKAVTAVVTVHGTGENARMQALHTGPVGNVLARTFSVDLANWGEPGVSGDFLLPGFTSASQVDLVSVTYDDGSTWRLEKTESCRVSVDPMMLINR